MIEIFVFWQSTHTKSILENIHLIHSVFHPYAKFPTSLHSLHLGKWSTSATDDVFIKAPVQVPFEVSFLFNRMSSILYTDLWTHDYIAVELAHHRDEIMGCLMGDLPLEAIGWQELSDEEWLVELEAWAESNRGTFHAALRNCKLGYLLVGYGVGKRLADATWSIGVGLHHADLIDDQLYECIMGEKGSDIIEQLIAESSGELSVRLRQLLVEHGLGSLWSSRTKTQRVGEFSYGGLEPVFATGGCVGCSRGSPEVVNRPCGHKELCYGCWWKRISGAHKCKKCDQIVVDYG